MIENAGLVERPISDERLAEVRRDLAKATVPEQLALYPAGVMLSLIARLDVAEAAAAQRIRELEAALAALYEWYDRDGSVGAASDVFEKHRAAAIRAGAPRAPETQKGPPPR